MMFLLAASPWADLPGGNEALRGILTEHPWLGILDTTLRILSLLLNIGAVWLLISNRKLFTRRLPDAPWSFGAGVQLLGVFGISYFLIMILNTAVRQELGGFLHRHHLGEQQLIVIGTTLAEGVALSLLFLFSRRIKKASGTGLIGYWKGPKPAVAIAGVPLFVMVLIPVAVAFAAVQIVFSALKLDFEPQPLVTLLEKTPEVWFVVVVSFFAVIVAPMVEEMLFRGILYPSLRQRWGVWPAALINSFFFALLHFHMPTFLPLFILALFFTFAFEYTGSLAVCIIAHSLFNSASIILIWFLRRAQ